MEHSLCSRKSLSIKGEEERKKTRGKFDENFTKTYQIVFHFSPKLSIHRHFSAIVGASGQILSRTVGRAEHICCFCNTDFFICFNQINWFFGFSELPVERALSQLPALPEALLTEDTDTCQALLLSLGCTFHSPPPILLFSFSKSVKLKKDCAQRIPCSTQKHTHPHRKSNT